MKKQILTSLAVGGLLFGSAGAAHALTTIGTAGLWDDHRIQYYNLIWDDDNNGNSLVWLDYTTQVVMEWSGMMAGAAALGPQLTINLNPGYSIAWNDPSWRLPSAGPNPSPGGFPVSDNPGITSSELGHLFYAELGLDWAPFPDETQLNVAGFEHLNFYSYWYGTEYAADQDKAWFFDAFAFTQATFDKDENFRGLFVRSGQVTYSGNNEVDPVPVPAAMLLFGTGLAGLAGARIRRKKHGRLG